MRIVKRQGDDVVVETSGAGKLQPNDFEAVDLRLIEAVYKKIAPKKPDVDEPPKKEDAVEEKKMPPNKDTLFLKKKKKQ
jgi:hypothetical protein